MTPAEVVPSAGMLPVDEALRETEIIASLGIIISCLESLWDAKDTEEDGLISWRVSKTARPHLTRGRKATVFDRAFTPPGINLLYSLRLTAAAVAALPGSSRRVKTAALSVLASTELALHQRTQYGMDGSDHTNVIACAGLLASKLFPRDAAAREACTAFIAAQSILSYLASGAVKVTSSYWRDGSAMRGIFRTRTYGTRWLSQLFIDHPQLAKVSGWGVWAGELLFPLVLVAPKPVAAALIGTGTAFHTGTAALMGLNRFAWGFGSLYPCVRHHSRHLTKRRPGHG